MRWSFFALLGLMSLSAAAPPAVAAEDYAVLIISRERLEVPTNCEIGLYLNDQLAGRLFQEQATSFNLPAGNLSLRLKLLPGQSPGCLPGLLAPPAQVSLLRPDIILVMSRLRYSIEDWVHDTKTLYTIVTASSSGSPFRTLEYTRRRYPEPWAARLARRISLAITFLELYRTALEDAAILFEQGQPVARDAGSGRLRVLVPVVGLVDAPCRLPGVGDP